MRAALPDVAFDGWSRASFERAAARLGVEPALARAAAPRGGLDLALAFHAEGDREMLDRLGAADLSGMRFRDRIAFAVRTRIELIEDREAVRRAMALFALPQNAPEGARALWGTADAIWTALGDTSRDLNWYSKRATLSGVLGSTVLYWLGDSSPGAAETWAFLDRRIDDVMQIERLKARAREAPLLRRLLEGSERLAERVRAPGGPGPAGPGDGPAAPGRGG